MPEQENPRRKFRIAMLSLAAVAIVAVGAALYLMSAPERNGADGPAVAAGDAEPLDPALASGAVSAFVVKETPAPVPEISFKDAEGGPRTLKDWRGRVVLLNLWATWCAPCREEMPALAKLQKELGGEDFEVVAVSIDREGGKVAGPFLEEVGATNLALYQDPSTKILNALMAPGLPTTLLIDRQGHELGRLMGPAVWDSQEAKALVSAVIADGKTAE
ncbi:TlpA family protein disulfide reductase [Kaustia mangrovi]|nr:TlpA disulfide reductase family protein [Kaustia mangrovi]